MAIDDGMVRLMGELELQDYKAALLAGLRFGGSVQVRVLDQYVVDSARARSDRPAYIKLAVSDDVVQQIRGTQRSAMLLVDFPIEEAINCYQQRTDHKNSRIFRPSDAGMSTSQILSASKKAERRGSIIAPK